MSVLQELNAPYGRLCHNTITLAMLGGRCDLQWANHRIFTNMPNISMLPVNVPATAWAGFTSGVAVITTEKNKPEITNSLQNCRQSKVVCSL